MAEFICHYTSAEATKSILHSGILRASNARSLDDKYELIGGGIALCDVLSQMPLLNGRTTFNKKYLDAILSNQSSENFYILSFCSDEDNQYLWENYAKNGCCLIFEKSKLLEGVKQANVDLACPFFSNVNIFIEIT